MAPHGNRCYLPVEHSLSCPSIIGAFSKEFIEHYRRGCQNCRDLVLPRSTTSMRQNIPSRIRLAGLLRNSGRTPIFQDRRDGLRISGSGSVSKLTYYRISSSVLQ